jgi:hypothetical protein
MVTSQQAEERTFESFVRVSRSGALMRIGVWERRSSGPHLRLLACCRGRVVGAATVNHDADGAPVLWIRVSAAWREEGIRERLAEVASEVAADRGLKPISMRDEAPMAADLDHWLMAVDALNPAVP